jgi:hypothetical protein
MKHLLTIGDFHNITATKSNLKQGASYNEKFASLSAGPRFAIQYLGEFETEFENVLGC